MEYRDALLEHLANYKTAVLSVTEDGYWDKKRPPYRHLLPQRMAALNLVETIREPCLAYFKHHQKKLHKGFHHLNSSQAFALNLFFPLLQDPADRRALLDVLGVQGNLAGWEFEAEPDSSEGTNFDLVLSLADRRVYIEVKLTEAGFGRGRVDDIHRDKLTRIYLPRLDGKVSAAVLQERQFFRHYQLLRNISYLDMPPNSIVLLVYPRANAIAEAEVSKFMKEVLNPNLAHRVRRVHVEDLILNLEQHEALSGAAREVLRATAAKYGMPTSTPAGV